MGMDEDEEKKKGEAGGDNHATTIMHTRFTSTEPDGNIYR